MADAPPSAMNNSPNTVNTTLRAPVTIKPIAGAPTRPAGSGCTRPPLGLDGEPAAPLARRVAVSIADARRPVYDRNRGLVRPFPELRAGMKPDDGLPAYTFRSIVVADALLPRRSDRSRTADVRVQAASRDLARVRGARVEPGDRRQPPERRPCRG